MIETMVLALALAQYTPDNDANNVAWYRFESGALTTDSSTNSNTLTNVNTVTVEGGDFKEGAGCASFSGANNFSLADSDMSADWPLSFGASRTAPFTALAWFKFTSTGNSVIFGCWENRDTTPGPKVVVWSVQVTDVFAGSVPRVYGTVAMQNEGGGGGGNESYVPAATPSILTVSTGTWYHAVFHLDAGSDLKRFTLYDADSQIERETSGTFSGSGGFEPWDNETPFFVGAGDAAPLAGSDGTLDYFSGLIDDLLIFDRELTSDEIDEIRAGTFAGVPAGGGSANASKQVLRIGME